MNRLHILGSGSGISVSGRFKSSIVIQTENKNYMFDAGEGCSYLYKNQRLNPHDLKSIFITHIHMDHISGIFQVIEDLKLEYYIQPSTEKNHYIDIFIPQIQTEDFKNVLNVFKIDLYQDNFNIRINKVTTSLNLFKDKNISVSAHRTMHDIKKGIIAYGYIIKVGNKTIYYSGDLDSISEIKDHINCADVAIVELAHYDLDEISPYVKDFKGILILSHIGKKYGNKKSPEYRNLIRFMNTLKISYVIAEDGIVFDLD
jgi:ribonuclease BN (tRNA processing enzyme)